MLRDIIPAQYRKAIYTGLGILAAVEAIWDFIPNGVESRIFATAAALGFSVAAGNTAAKTEG